MALKVDLTLLLVSTELNRLHLVSQYPEAVKDVCLLVPLKPRSGSNIQEMQNDLQSIMEDSWKGIEVLEAREGLLAMKEANAHLQDLPEQIPSDLREVRKQLERAQDVLNACVETVISNKLNLFPPLAEPKDWDLPGTHLPIGATIKFGDGKSSNLTVASWVVVEDWHGLTRLSCDSLCQSYTTFTFPNLPAKGMMRRW